MFPANYNSNAADWSMNGTHGAKKRSAICKRTRRRSDGHLLQRSAPKMPPRRSWKSGWKKSWKKRRRWLCRSCCVEGRELIYLSLVAVLATVSLLQSSHGTNAGLHFRSSHWKYLCFTHDIGRKTCIDFTTTWACTDRIADLFKRITIL